MMRDIRKEDRTGEKEVFLSVVINSKGGPSCKVVGYKIPTNRGNSKDAFITGVYAAGEIASSEGVGYSDVFIMNVFDSRELARKDCQEYLAIVRGADKPETVLS